MSGSSSSHGGLVEEQLRGNRPGGPSPFAQYLAYAPLVPFESSPLAPRALSDLAAAGGGIGAAVGAYATGDSLLLLAVPAGIVVCGAAHGLAEALRIGLRAKLLHLMGVDDPDTDHGDSEPSPSRGQHRARSETVADLPLGTRTPSTAPASGAANSCDRA